MNKLFKWIYYPTLFVLAVVLFALGILGAIKKDSTSEFSEDRRTAVSTHIATITDYGARNDSQLDAMTSTANYIHSAVRSNGSTIKYHSADNPDTNGLNTRASYICEDRIPKPTVVSQNAKILPSTSEKIGNGYYVDRTIVNIVVAIPGTDTIAKYADIENEALSCGDVIMFTAHYDSSTLGEGAVNNAASVANMVELIKQVAGRETQYKNDFVFVFTAGEEEGAIGAYAFTCQFKGFDDIYSRVKLAFNFDAKGDAGFVVMNEMNGDSSLASAYASVSGKSYTSSIYSTLSSINAKASDFDVYDRIAAMNFTTLSDANTGTIFDNQEALSDETVNALGNIMLKVTDYFGDKNISDYKSDGKASVGFFNYLGGNIWYANYVAYIVAAFVILLMAAVTAVSIKLKVINLAKTALGALAQVISIALTIICLYAIFFIVAFVLCGFEVINVHAIFTVVYSSIGALIFAVILTIAFAIIFYCVLQKMLSIRAVDMAHGGILVLALLSVIMCFAFPDISYIFSLISVFQLAIMLVNTLFAEKFKKKFGFEINRLLLYVIPVILMLPVLGSELWVAYSTTAAVLLPLYLVTILLYGGVIIPYADNLTKKIKTICCEQKNVSIAVSALSIDIDNKKNQAITKLSNCKRLCLNYTTTFGASVVAFISTIAITLFSAFGGGFGSGVSSNFSYYDEIYKDSIVYVSENSKNSIEIRDLDAYKYFTHYIDGFYWDNEKNAYIKSENVGALNFDKQLTVSASNSNKKLFTVESSATNTAHMIITLSGYGSGNIDKVKFTTVGGKEIEIDLSANNDNSVTFRLPYGFSDGFSFEIEGSAESVNITIEQSNVFGPSTSIAQNNSVFATLAEAYSSGNDEIKNNLKFSVIMRVSNTFIL